MVNKVILVGRLGNDPEFKEQENMKVANFSLATNESFKDKEGNKMTNTEWHRIVAFGKLAELVKEYCKKGNIVYVEGKIKTNSWEKDGEKRYSTDIIADQVRFLDNKKEE